MLQNLVRVRARTYEHTSTARVIKFMTPQQLYGACRAYFHGGAPRPPVTLRRGSTFLPCLSQRAQLISNVARTQCPLSLTTFSRHVTLPVVGCGWLVGFAIRRRHHAP
jgi:hypothetical protein